MTDREWKQVESHEIQKIKRELNLLLRLSESGNVQGIKNGIGIGGASQTLLDTYLEIRSGNLSVPTYNPDLIQDGSLAMAWADFFKHLSSPSSSMLSRVTALLRLLFEFAMDVDKVSEEVRKMTFLTEKQKKIFDAAAKSLDKNWEIFHRSEEN